MLTLTEEDRKFYSENAPALIGYANYVQYVFGHRDNFGGNENVELALQIGKFIGRNEINRDEAEEIKLKIDKLCKNDEKAQKAKALLNNRDKLQELVSKVVGTNPNAFMIVSPKGDILLDSKGLPVPNLLKISLALALELDNEI